MLSKADGSTIDPESFSPRRYGRGSVWAIDVWKAAHGIERNGRSDIVVPMRGRFIELTSKNTLNEYFDPETSECLGRTNFS